jgi:hypothetical protein
VFQFANATLVGPRTYEVSLRLRGQAGTDGLNTSWPIGSRFVLINDALRQIDIAQSARGLARHYRIGPSQRPYDDPSYEHTVEAFDGIGLRPYAPTHVSARKQVSGDTNVTWVRRTRLDGDNWQSTEVPLGETSENYVVQVVQGGAVLREEIVTTPSWTYAASQKTADGLSGLYTIQIAQMSDSFGAGLFKRIDLNE